jgi:ABC-2 type transport system permease protein
MLTCAAYIGVVILLQAGPVYWLFMADLHGRTLSTATWLWIGAAFSAAFVLSILAVVLPLRFGIRRLSRMRI